MSGTITPERALEIARELWPWAKYIACDTNWTTRAFHKRPQFDGQRWYCANSILTALIGSNIAWPQEKIADRILADAIVPTDEDAKRRPLVMVKEEQHDREWYGPVVLVAVTPRRCPFVVFDENVVDPDRLMCWTYCKLIDPADAEKSGVAK